MNHDQVEQEISIIRDMIEKTRKDSSRFGHLLIFMGIAAGVFLLALSILDRLGRFQWAMPVMIGMTIINGFVGSIIVKRSLKKNKVAAYPKTVFLNLWVVCSMALLLIAFVFPLFKTATANPVASFVSLILGIAIYMSGVICEMPLVQLSSLSWPAAALLMAALPSRYHILIMLTAIILGWILPGILINRLSEKRDGADAIQSHS
jgi:hypothetical protein